MGPPIDPVTTDAALPERADVVIVGGGIIGTTAALFLAQKGVSVALCEKGVIAGEQSSRNWGWCRKTVRDPREIPLVIEALRLWGDMSRLLEAETGFRQGGALFVADSDQEMARLEAWLEHARDFQLDSRLVSGAALEDLLPASTVTFKGAVHTPSDGRAEPQKAAPAIAAAARRLGASVLTQCAVRGVETAGGRIAGVVTEKGRIACDAVVLAGGIWSRLFCRSLDLRLPQLKVQGTVMRTAPMSGAGEANVWTSKGAFRKRLDGGYTIARGTNNIADIVPDSFNFFSDFLPALRVERKALRFRLGRRFLEEARLPRRVALDRPSPYERLRVYDPKPAYAVNAKARAGLAAAFPVFERIEVVQEWAGLIDVTPDVIPVISAVDDLPGFFIATGFSGHGFGIGPGAGRLVADLVRGDPTIVDPGPFRFSRFTDGSRPRPEVFV